jgi:hypothetical protein
LEELGSEYNLNANRDWQKTQAALLGKLITTGLATAAGVSGLGKADTLKNVRDGLGSQGPSIGHSWYGGI